MSIYSDGKSLSAQVYNLEYELGAAKERIDELGGDLEATVTAEQVEAAAHVLAEMNGEPRPGRFERTMTRAAFRAAGLRIEGEGDD